MLFPKFFIKLAKFLTPHGIVILVERYYKYGKFKKPWNLNTKHFWDYQYRRGYSFVEENYRPIPKLIKSQMGVTIIDLGCGTGEGVNYLAEKIRGSEISGADISEVAIEKASKNYPENDFFELDLNEEVLTQKYDYVVIVETLEHINEPLIVVNEILKVVGKFLIVSVPYSPDKPSGPVPEGGDHVYYFNDDTFIKYKHKIVHKDVLHNGTMPRIIYKIYPK
jgi:SAM-dependent methyltransferase